MYDVNICECCVYARTTAHDWPCKVCSVMTSKSDKSYFRKSSLTEPECLKEKVDTK